MSRTYAGILGAIAFTTTTLRGLLAGSGLEATVLDAMVMLICFTVVGAVIGLLAERTVLESIRAQLVQQAASNKPDAQDLTDGTGGL